MLSLALGKTLSEIEEMPESHFQEYMLFYEIQFISNTHHLIEVSC